MILQDASRGWLLSSPPLVEFCKRVNPVASAVIVVEGENLAAFSDRRTNRDISIVARQFVGRCSRHREFMSYIFQAGAAALALVLPANVIMPAMAQELQPALSAVPSVLRASPQGRLLIGRGKDYLPSQVDPLVLFDELQASMKKRRDFAWKVVEQVLQPIKIRLPDGEVEVPLWHTWFEGRKSSPSANQEIDGLFRRYFEKLKPVLEADPNADIQPVVEDTIKEFATRDLSSSLTNENLSSVLHQLTSAAEAGRLVGQGTTMFSPSYVEHVMKEARKIDECEPDTATADQDPPRPDQFSHCIEEFPRSAVMVKTSWRRLSQGIPDHDTGASALSEVIEEGTWPGPGRPDLSPPIAHPDRSQIYTNITSQGTEWALTGIHFVTKDVREWVWISLWWDPEASKDFGADRPASIERFNNGVWANYKMCVSSSFAERDPKPWVSYVGAESSLGASIKAVYDALQHQIDNGSVLHFQDFAHFFKLDEVPNPLLLSGNLGPWPAPHNAQTSWCSNPNIEVHAANARTNCIGCHQISFTRNERRHTTATFMDALAGDLPQFARSRARKNFTAEFSWSFQFEFKPAIAQAKALTRFDWPSN